MDLVKIALAGALAIAVPFAVLPPQGPPALPLVEYGPAAAHDHSETDATRTSDQAPSEPASYVPDATGATQALRIPSRTEPPKLAPLEHRDVWSADIEEASRRFGIPSSWVRSVMQVESAGRQLFDGRPITSPAGAMGLMQLMPETYAELRARYGLGADPYDPRDNLLAGTAYLRELYDRFGAPGFIAAYNAGPGRVGELLTRGRQLPDETQRYVAAIRRTPAGAAIVRSLASSAAQGEVEDLTGLAPLTGRSPTQAASPLRLAQAPLFVASGERGTTDARQDGRKDNALFVVLSDVDQRSDRRDDHTRSPG